MNWKGLELYGTVCSDPEPLQSRTIIESRENECFFFFSGLEIKGADLGEQ